MNFLVSILYYFRQVAKIFGKGNFQNTLGGNLDPFYLICPLYFYENYKDRKKMKKIMIIILSIFIFGGIQYLFIDNVNFAKMLINMSKITICIVSMIYVKENYKKINIFKITKITSIFFAISIPLSIIFYKSSVIWRHNDIHNKYNLSRLELFYLEPSELGFHIAILIIFLVGYLFVSNNMKERFTLASLILTNSIILYMAKPLGAIVIVAFSIGIMTLLDFIYNPSKFKAKLYFAFLIVFTLSLLIMFINESPIIMRLIDTLHGTDSSNSYRIGVTLDVFRQSFIDYKGLGCGFGNLNTENFISRYRNLGLVVVVTNSFFYFMIETGILGIIALIIFTIYMVKKCLRDKSVIKWGLFTFLLLYQIFGGHFTSGLYWVLYGIIFSGYNERDMLI